MFQFIQILAWVVGALPNIIKMIQVAEDTIGPGNGSAKLEMVKQTVQGAYTLAEDMKAPFEAVWPLLSNSIAGIVSAHKQAGTVPTAQPDSQEQPAQAAPAAPAYEPPFVS